MKSKKLTSLEIFLIVLFVLMTGACIALIVLHFVKPEEKRNEPDTCSSIHHLSGTSGSIYSLNYPSNYENSKTCAWEITVPDNKVVHFWFEEFHVEASTLCSEDRVTIEDNVGVLGTHCGHTLPKPLVSVGNRIFVTFITNSETSDKGFHAKYEAVDPKNIADIVGGGGFLEGNTGEFQSPSTYNNKNYDLYQWKISVDAGHRVQLSFTSFDLELPGPAGCNEMVEIYDGEKKGSQKLGQFCGKEIPESVSASSNSMLVRFRANQGGVRGSFQAKYIAFEGSVIPTESPSYIDSGCGSNALQKGRKGFLYSMNYPDTYPANLTCNWNISVTPGWLVKLTFFDLSMDGELGQCTGDKLEISDSYDMIGIYCGFLKPPVIISSTNKLFLKFSTDKVITDHGFELKWEEVKPDDIEEIQSCGGGSTEESGVIKSPNWPNNYAPNKLCVWHLQVPEGKKIILTFTHFDLEDVDITSKLCYDYVAAYEESSGQTIKRGPFCGTTVPTRITSNSNTLILRFYSDIFTESKGFRAYWSTSLLQTPPTEAPPAPNPWDNIQIEWPNKCGQPTFPPQIYSRIVNGEPAIPHTWPWQVSMQVWPSSRNETIFLHTCGGTLIHKNWVLTAAHCFINYADELHRWQMCLGKHNLTLVEPTEKCYKILGIYRHEGFVYPEIPALEFDIALVRLDGEVVANDYIDFACLPPLDQVLSESYRCHATGWGDETGNSTVPKAAEGLNQVALPVIAYEVCKTPAYWWFQIKESMICAGYVKPDELKSVCQGDSGGPLVCPSTKNSSIWEVHGVTSFGPIGCIMDKKPSVFTRTSAHLDWIDNIIKKDIYDTYSSGCGSAMDFSDRTGEITSMRYPATYSNNANCIWNIVAPADEVIHLHFNSFVLEESGSCNNDRVVISDELGSVGAHCGDFLPADLVSFSNKLSVNFRSNSRLVDVGFRASWQFMKPASIPNITTCGGHFTADKGVLTSPNWPNSYPSSKACTWKITVDPSDNIHIVFTNFNLQFANLTGGCQDFVEVFDGEKPGATKLGHFCGTTVPKTLNTTGNTAVIKFVSNHVQNARGFYGYWTTNLTDIPTKEVTQPKPWDNTVIDWPAHCHLQSVIPSGSSHQNWHVSIQTHSKLYLPFQHKCAGSLIHSEWILLPAHCIDSNQQLDSWRVCLASDATGTCVGTDAFIRHEDFVHSQGNVYFHDIALLHLSDKVTNIQPVCLPDAEETVSSGEICYWAGWDTDETGGEVTSTKFQVLIPIMSYKMCSQPSFWQNELTASMVCGGFDSPEKLRSTCRSGAEGALICQSASHSTWEVQGITSFGPNNCLVERKPQVFTKVSAYREWVEDKIKKYSYEKNIAQNTI
ncbi:ovochymase-2-like [Dendropsophus ebraccatus]|uniref:ovochymase-2-like n=1 Tax=Dendropsophus ebraccatus TaxID=150705 RepID=UPI0038315669